MGRVLRNRIILDKESTPQKITDFSSRSNSSHKKRIRKRRRRIHRKKKISPELIHAIKILQETSNQHVNNLENMNDNFRNITVTTDHYQQENSNAFQSKVIVPNIEEDVEIANDDFKNNTDTADDLQQENSHAVQSKAIVPNIENNDIIDLTNITIKENAQSSSQLVSLKTANDIIDITDTIVSKCNNVSNTSPFKETSCDSDSDTDIEINSCLSNVKQVKTEIETILLDSSDEENTTHQQPIEKHIKEPLVVSKINSIPAFSTDTKKRKYKSPLLCRKRAKIDEIMPGILNGNFEKFGFIVDRQKINHHSRNFQNIGHNAKFPKKHEPLSAKTSIANKQLRPIIIDGLNIGHAHGHGTFSAKGIDLCVNYFANRGHKEITAFIPQHRQGPPGSKSNKILNKLDKMKHICFTPSRKVQNERMTCYDDRILLDYANRCGGVVVSNDNYRDMYEESDAFKDVIENRQVMVTFVRDEILVPEDQYNRRAAVRSLSEILCFP